MSVKITVIVETSTSGNTVQLTRVTDDSNDNPRFYGDSVRRHVAVLGNVIAHQLDQLTDKPLTDD